MATLPGPSFTELALLPLRGSRRPHEVALELHQRYGPVVHLPFSPYVYVFGQAANELVLSAKGDLFTWREALAPLEPVDGPTALVLSDGEDHRRRRQLVQPAFAARRIDAAIPVIVAEVDRIIDDLAPGAPVDLYAAYRRAVRRIVTRVLFGDALAGQADRLGEVLEPAIRFVDRPRELQFSASRAGRAARRARAAADMIVDAEMARRRDSGQAGGDVLGVLLGSGLSDAEIRDQVVSLIAAGYDTTSAGVGWTVLELLRHPEQWQKAQAETARRLGNGRPPEADDLRAMSHVAAVVKGAVRLWPPAPLSGRRATRSFPYAGYTIPKGSTVVFSPYVTHRDQQLWGKDADRYRPERWSEQEPEPFSFIPFGGTYRRCIGFALALTEIQVVITRLLQRTQLRLADAHRVVRGIGLSALRPEGGVSVVVEAVK